MADGRVERDRAVEVAPPPETAEPQLRSRRPGGSAELAGRLTDETSSGDARDQGRSPEREVVETPIPEQRGLTESVVEERAFTSMSSSSESAFAANAQFDLDSHNGRDISEYSTYQSENEILVDRGTQFQVLSNEYDER